ncbi:MAG: sigma-70 family RNA polymerase sigma factor [Candidatus Hydrogenedentes bacterium]|nr:sigma-70 family RNA polymerase sigma factor [Candidatus Hydrogenedentota bacterium]
MITAVESTEMRSEEFEQLVLEHCDLLYTVALRLTHNPADAEDLVQNTLVKAMRFHHRFKKGTYIKAWLLTILRNTFINDYRQRSRRPTFVELTGMEPAPAHAPEPQIAFEPGEENLCGFVESLDDEIKSAIEMLPQTFKQAVIMADLADMTYQEIASAMHSPLGTVMSRLYRGRKLLREQLADVARARRIGLRYRCPAPNEAATECLVTQTPALVL